MDLDPSSVTFYLGTSYSSSWSRSLFTCKMRVIILPHRWH